MGISAKLVKELRQKTGAGMLNCKKALEVANGDMQVAIENLRKSGIAKAEKKAGRVAAEGLVVTAVTEDSKSGIVLEFNTETDFSAKNEAVLNFANKVAKIALDEKLSDVEALKAIEIDGTTVKTQLTELIAKIGENMNIRRLKITEAPDGFIQTYLHMGGKIGVVLAVSGDKKDASIEVAKDISMHIAAMNPRFLDKSEVTTELLEKEKEIARVQLKNEGKDDKIIEKILIGKMNKFYEENCLLQQKFVKDDKLKVEKYAKSAGLSVLSFDRFLLGDGIEKEEVDFAEEVRKQVESK